MRLIKTYRQGWQATTTTLSQKKPLLLLLGLYPLMLWLFVYFTNLNLFAYILRNADLSNLDKIDFFWQAFLNIFRYITDPLALSIIIFSFLAAVNVTMLIYAIKRKRKAHSKGQAATILALAGSHCLTCGGSLLAPVITAMVGSGAYISAARADASLWLALIINVVAILLISHATLKSAAISQPGHNQAAATPKE